MGTITSTATIVVDVVIGIIAVTALILASIAFNNDNNIQLTGAVIGSGTKSISTTVSRNANLTGDVTSVGNVTTIPLGSITPGMLQTPFNPSIPPTQQIFSTATGAAQTYTLPTTRMATYLRIQMVGAGSGGSASNNTATISQTSGLAGTNSYFGTNVTTPELVCGGGQASFISSFTIAGAGGLGGQVLSTSLGSGFSVDGVQGETGTYNTFPLATSGTQLSVPGSMGGLSPFFGSVLPSLFNGASALYGGGGGSGGVTANVSGTATWQTYIGGAGGSGAYLDFIIPGPLLPTYFYWVGSGGAGGTGGSATGGNGGNGLIIITEYY
jgi:hypothetical protein